MTCPRTWLLQDARPALSGWDRRLWEWVPAFGPSRDHRRDCRKGCRKAVDSLAGMQAGDLKEKVLDDEDMKALTLAGCHLA